MSVTINGMQHIFEIFNSIWFSKDQRKSCDYVRFYFKKVIISITTTYLPVSAFNPSRQYMLQQGTYRCASSVVEIKSTAIGKIIQSSFSFFDCILASLWSPRCMLSSLSHCFLLSTAHILLLVFDLFFLSPTLLYLHKFVCFSFRMMHSHSSWQFVHTTYQKSKPPQITQSQLSLYPSLLVVVSGYYFPTNTLAMLM